MADKTIIVAGRCWSRIRAKAKLGCGSIMSKVLAPTSVGNVTGQMVEIDCIVGKERQGVYHTDDLSRYLRIPEEADQQQDQVTARHHKRSEVVNQHPVRLVIHQCEEQRRQDHRGEAVHVQDVTQNVASA